MDWTNVTAEDLVEALWDPFSEFFASFTVPRSYARRNSRLKCNIYYYRTNYFMMIVFILGLGFLRRPLIIVASVITVLGIALLNDSFAGAFNIEVTRTVRLFSPHLAAILQR